MCRAAFLAIPAVASCDPWGPIWPEDEAGPDVEDTLVVSPASIDFGTISVIADGFRTETFTVTNAGTETLTVHGHDEVVGDAVFEVAADPLFQLGPGESREVQVTFRPLTDGAWAAELRVNYGVETVSLAGTATAPVVALEVPEIPSTAVGCESRLEVQLANAGSEPLEISRVVIPDSTDFDLEEGYAGTIEPGASVPIPVVFRPGSTTRGTRTGHLSVSSNDPLDPLAEVALQGLGYEGEAVEEEFVYAPGGTVDLLFLADTAGVMASHIIKADEATEALVAALDEDNIDVHATVITGSSDCPATTVPYVTSSDDESDRADALRAGFHGEAGDASGRLLAHAASALARTGEGDCLSGFLREDAHLFLVAIAGGPESSGQSPADLVASVEALAPDAASVVVSAIVATAPEGCEGAEYGSGYTDAAVLTGGEISNLCDVDWEPAFQGIARLALRSTSGGLVRSLAQEPVAETLEVTVDGASFTSWTYDEVENAIVFDARSAPAGGSEVIVSYLEAVPCTE